MGEGAGVGAVGGFRERRQRGRLQLQLGGWLGDCRVLGRGGPIPTLGQPLRRRAVDQQKGTQASRPVDGTRALARIRREWEGASWW